MTIIPMYSRPDLYEVSYDGALPDELPFVKALLLTHCGPQARVLELAAGSGRVTIPLAASGFRMTALDREPAMLARLQANARAARCQVACLEADIRRFATPAPVDAVLCMLGVACCACERPDFDELLSCIARSLRPRGISLLVLVAADNPADVIPHASTWHARRSDIQTQSWFCYDPDPSLSDPAIVHYQYRISATVRGGEPAILQEKGQLRIVSSSFLQDAAARAGLQVESWYPMFDLQHPGPRIPDKSGAAVAVLRRP